MDYREIASESELISSDKRRVKGNHQGRNLVRRKELHVTSHQPIIRKMKRLATQACLCLVFLSVTVPTVTVAQPDENIPETYKSDTDRYVFRQKLRRGITNAATGWLEIPYNIFSQVMFGTRSPFEGLVIGIISGTSKGLERTGIGLFETATFYIPSYEPILKPEYAQIKFGTPGGDDFGDPLQGLHVRPPKGVQ